MKHTRSTGWSVPLGAAFTLLGCGDAADTRSLSPHAHHTAAIVAPEITASLPPRFASLQGGPLGQGVDRSGGPDTDSAPVTGPLTQAHTQDFWPLDVSNFGGPTIASATSHSVYITDGTACATPECYGDPDTFLGHLFASDFIHTVDQYLPPSPAGRQRYTVGATASVPLATLYPSGAPTFPGGLNRVVIDADVQRALLQVVGETGDGGYANIYHVFLPPDVDVCIDGTDSVCYSPDSYYTWYLCAYHSAFTYTDASGQSHTVVYTVEPNAGYTPRTPPTGFSSGACRVAGTTPNGSLIDSQADNLSREVFAVVTNPGDPTSSTGGTGWLVSGTVLGGLGIGDECASNEIQNDGTLVPSLEVAPLQLSGAAYAIQGEYSNRSHACVTRPDGEGPPPSAVAQEYLQHPDAMFRYPGQVMVQATLRPIFVTDGTACANEDCFHHPSDFLDHFARSRLIHVADEYMPRPVDPFAPRYTPVAPVSVPLPSGLSIIPGGQNRVLLSDQIISIVQAEALREGHYGYDSLYVVYLPANLDTCDPGFTSCFAPDLPYSYFCAYHDGETVTDAAGTSHPIVFAVIPNTTSPTYDGVYLNCRRPPGSPNGPDEDEMAEASAHEILESITDPGPYNADNMDGNAWFNPELYEEIADECVEFGAFPNNLLTPVQDIAGKLYSVQRMYSNRAHLCVDGPVGWPEN